MRCSCRGSGKWEVNEIAGCLVAALAVRGWITVAQGQAAFGAGTASCGIEARTSDTTLKCRYSVGRGHLSGLNIAPAQARDALSTTDFDGVMGWINNYYRSNPLDPIIIAAKR